MRYKMPKTTLDNFINFFKKRKALERLALARVGSGSMRGQEASEWLKEKEKKMIREYKIEMKDRYFFETLKELYAFLKRVKREKGIEENIEEMIEHEKEHIDEAKRYGYETHVACWLLKKDKEVRLASQVSILFSRVNSGTYEDISRAPKKPSILDL